MDTVIPVNKRHKKVRVVVPRDIPQENPFFHVYVEPVVEEKPPPPKPPVDADVHEELVQKAYDRGFQDGQEMSANLMERELKQHEEWVRSIDNVAEQLQQQYSKSMSNLADSAVELAFVLANKILKHEAAVNSETIVAQVKKSLDKFHGVAGVQVKVHPADLEALQASHSLLSSKEHGIHGIELIADASIQRGGCIVETNTGRVDAQLSSQLSELVASLYAGGQE